MNEASIPNPALESFRVLIGRWNTEGKHPYVRDTVFHGQSVFEWMEGGAFVLMHSQIDEPEIPSGVAVFGSDDATGQFFMLYFDERGVSRKYDVAIKDNVLTWWRDSEEFSQRFTVAIADDGLKLDARGEMSKNGGAWEPDLSLTYTRSS